MSKRPRGSSRRRSTTSAATRFDELVLRALDAIPAPFADALDDVAIIVEDEPSRQQLRENGLGPDEGLYGLYEGVPLTEYGADWGFLPSKITLFRNPLVEDFADPAELEHEVWITVIHELAHHLGFGEERLHDLGVD
jgi:predicted Zn-dependent protease with MMP-like domain